MAKDLELSITLKADNRDLEGKLRLSEQQVKQLGAAFGQIKTGGDRAALAINRVAGHLQVMGHLAAAAFSGREIFQTLETFDRLNASLKTVTGSLENARIASAFIKNFAATTPFELSEVTDAFIRLKSLGLDASEASLRSFGNTESAMGKPLMQFIEAVADATTGEFERLKEFGIKASAQGDQVKFTFQGVTTTVANNAQAIAGYLKNLGDTQFASGMADQMQTLGGALSNLKDAFANFVDYLGSLGIREALMKSFAGATAFIQEFTQQLNAVFGTTLQAAADAYEIRLRELRNKLENQRALMKTPLIGGLLASPEDIAATERTIAEMSAQFERLKASIEAEKNAGAGKLAQIAAPSGSPTAGAAKTKAGAAKTRAGAANDALEEARAAFAVQQAEFQRQEAILDAQRDLELAKAGENAEKKLAVERDFNERLSALKQQRIEAEIRQKHAETNLIDDRGQQARALAEMQALEVQLAEARDLAALSADKLGAEEKRLADERAKARAEQVKAILAETPQGKARAQLDQEAVLGEAFRQGQISLDQLNAGIDVIRQRFGQTADDLNQFAVQAARNMQSGFADFLFDPFQDGLNGMLKGFLDMIRKMVAQAAAAQLMTALFGEGVASGKQGAQLGGLVKMGFDFVAGLFHSGGVVGTGGAARQVPAFVFDAAPRLHSGGFLKPGEVPAILMQGEEVLTANDPRHRNNFRPGGKVEVHVHEAPGTRATVESRETEQGPRIDVLIEMVKGAVQSDIAKGGDVARTMEQRYRLNPAAGAVR